MERKSADPDTTSTIATPRRRAANNDEPLMANPLGPHGHPARTLRRAYIPEGFRSPCAPQGTAREGRAGPPARFAMTPSGWIVSSVTSRPPPIELQIHTARSLRVLGPPDVVIQPIADEQRHGRIRYVRGTAEDRLEAEWMRFYVLHLAGVPHEGVDQIGEPVPLREPRTALRTATSHGTSVRAERRQIGLVCLLRPERRTCGPNYLPGVSERA